MKTYALIPSRFGSSRFPGKPLAVLAGKPLVAWVVEAVGRAKSPDEVLVATDDERIAKAVRSCGGKAVMTPSELPSGTDRIACAARTFLGRDFDDDDLLVNVQGDEPLIDPALVDALVARLRDEGEAHRPRHPERRGEKGPQRGERNPALRREEHPGDEPHRGVAHQHRQRVHERPPENRSSVCRHG